MCNDYDHMSMLFDKTYCDCNLTFYGGCVAINVVSWLQVVINDLDG